MDKLQEFLDLGGEIKIGMQNGRGLVSVHASLDGQDYACGSYFEDHKRLLDILEADGDFLSAGVEGIKRKKEELASGRC